MRSDEYEYAPRQVGDEICLEVGTYKTRLCKGGHFLPIEVVEIIERDDSGHISSDVIYRVFSWPFTQSTKCIEWEYSEVNPLYLKVIDKDEFKWMMEIKKM